MDAEKWRTFRLRWMLPIYITLAVLWAIALAITFALGGPTSPLIWFDIVLVAVILIVGIVSEWQYRREESSH